MVTQKKIELHFCWKQSLPSSGELQGGRLSSRGEGAVGAGVTPRHRGVPPSVPLSPALHSLCGSSWLRMGCAPPTTLPMATAATVSATLQTPPRHGWDSLVWL